MTYDRRKPSFEAILFDLDGTLLDSFEQHWRALVAALTDFDFEPPPVARIRQLMGLPGLDTVLTVGVPPEQAHDVWMRWAEWEGRLADLVHPFPDVVSLLARLRAAGYRLGIVTSRPRISLDSTPAALDLLPHVDLLVTRDDTADGKPHPAPILHAFQRLGVPTSRGVYVGDAAFDVEAGRRAGCLTVLTTWDDASLYRPTEPEPDFVVASPDELAVWLLD
jgi:HAD superfamily hydrolase (TIGR01509 family)